MALLFILCVFF